VCLTYFTEKSSLVPVQNHALFQSNKSDEDINDDTFLDYSCMHCVYHSLGCVMDGRYGLVSLLNDCIVSPEVTHSWLQRSLLLDRRRLWRLAIGLEELEALFTEMKEEVDVTKDVLQLCEGCAGVRRCLDVYGPIFSKSPSLIQKLELGSFYLGKSSGSTARPKVSAQREIEVRLHKSRGIPTALDSDFERTHIE
jgi:hypothetical protein